MNATVNSMISMLPHYVITLILVVSVSVINSETISTFIAGKQQNFKAWLK